MAATPQGSLGTVRTLRPLRTRSARLALAWVALAFGAAFAQTHGAGSAAVPGNAGWRGEGPSGCLEAVLDAAGLHVRACDGAFAPATGRAAHLERLRALIAAHAPFEAEAGIGAAWVAGTGSAEASVGVRRQAVELLRALALEAAAGRPGAAALVVLELHAGATCPDATGVDRVEVLTVARTGEVAGWGCVEGVWSDRGQAWLPDVALAWLYMHLDGYAGYDGPVGGARLVFGGRGGVPVDEEAAASIAGSAFGFRGLLAR